jgi:RNA polymerase sigma-70 factor (ECF subfamily)
VKDGETTGEDRAMRFRTTQWDLVFDSGDSGSPHHDKALAEVCSLYWYPLYTFARCKGFSEADAEDLTQSFFLHLLDKGALKQAQPDKGRFRSFMLACFQNHIFVHRKRASAAKRGGGSPLVSLDTDQFAEHERLEPADDATAETVFDAQWARVLIERVLMRLAEEYRRRGKANFFERLRAHLNVAGEKTAASYETSAQELGLSLAAVKTLVSRLRKRFAALLRNEVAKTVLDPNEIDAEIHSLYEALVATEGRLER